MKNVVVVGGTGMVGREVLRQLGAREDVRVFALTRRLAGLSQTAPAGRVKEVLFDFESPSSYERIGADAIPCDVLICCIGSTMRAAGSKEAFRKIERDIPQRLVERAAKLAQKPTFAFVSSAGAHRPVGFYLDTKVEVESSVRASGLPFVIARPSLLLGDRKETRVGERVATIVIPPLMGVASFLTFGALKGVELYKPVRAEKVAEALIRETVDRDGPRSVILEGRDFR